MKVDDRNISDLLGVKKFKYGLAEKSNQIGVATGLAWTEVGGDLLSIEAIKLPGKGRMKSTGKLGEVMKESIDAASSFVRSRSPSFGIVPTLFDKYDIHVHVPEGATPKDGPSAGAAMTTAVASVLSNIPVRADVAMTGEITLRGEVLKIGGLKEKIYAAIRAGIKTVLIPDDKKNEIKEFDKQLLKNVKIVPIVEAKSVLKYTLIKPINPLNITESQILESKKTTQTENNLKQNLTH